MNTFSSNSNLLNSFSRPRSGPFQPQPADEEIEVFDLEGALSRAFLLARGFCCTNGCKNCPYGFDPTLKEEKAP